MSEHTIEHKPGINGRFVVGDLAELTYTMSDPHHATLDHTNVDATLRHEGIGRKLVDAAVAWARASDVKLTPVCSYARKVFDEDPSLADVRE
jgi:uncharacterized protein